MPPKKYAQKWALRSVCLNLLSFCRAVGTGGPGHVPPDFWQQKEQNLFLKMTGITVCPSIFSDLPTALFLRVVILLSGVCKLCKIGFGRVATLMD